MKKMLLFVLCMSISSQFSFSASKRKMYLSAGTYATANSDTQGIEATVWITNPSTVNQKVHFNSVKMLVYAYSYFNYPQSFYNAFTPAVIGKWNTGTAAGHNMDTGFSASNLTSPATLAPNETLEIKMYAKPYSNMAPFFGNADFGRQHYASFYGGGMYMGQIFLTGYIETEDETTPGFVIGSAAILKPANIGGSITTLATEFQLNSGKPF